MPVLNLTQPLGLTDRAPGKAAPHALPAACCPVPWAPTLCPPFASVLPVWGLAPAALCSARTQQAHAAPARPRRREPLLNCLTNPGPTRQRQMAAPVNFQMCPGLAASFPSRAVNRLSREASPLFLWPESTFCHGSCCPASPLPLPAEGLVGLSLMTPPRKSLPLAALAGCPHCSLTFLTLLSPMGWQNAGCWKGSQGPGPAVLV